MTERVRGKVTQSRFDDLPEALRALERRGHELEARGDGNARRVTGRLELSVKAGVDVRGDGSVIPFTGRWNRRIVEREQGESAYDALRRILLA